MNPAPRNRKLFLWPAAAIVIAVLVPGNPWYAPKISLHFGTIAWLVDMAVALICWVHPVAARVGVLLTGLFMGIASFVHAPPLFRGWLMCGMILPVVLASIPVVAPSVTGFRARLTLLCSFDHTRELMRSPRYFDSGSVLRLFVATTVFAVALDAVESVPARAFWYLARWLAGGVMIFAVAEMWTAFHKFLAAGLGLTTPLLMESPMLSKSVSEFWNRRWNPGTSFMVRRLCFEPMARHSPILAFFGAFIVSGVIHALLFFMALLSWKMAVMNGAFFFAQPLLILTERKLNVHRWPAAAAHTWTFVVLAITSPLFVEPVIQVIYSFGSPGSVLPATFVVLAVSVFATTLFLGAALVACSGVGTALPHAVETSCPAPDSQNWIDL
ncbi:MAG TPA: MBOAT family protein [Verrucomicrobiae bacterium]|nr:MBOAT family protein [Verrucomicrobiae bacterium]